MEKGWKEGKHIPLDTSVQIGVWKEKINTEQRQAKMRTASQIISL